MEEESSPRIDLGMPTKRRFRIEDEDSLPDLEEGEKGPDPELCTFDLAQALTNYKKLLKFLSRTRLFEERLDNMDRILNKLGLAHNAEPVTQEDLKTQMLSINSALDAKF